MVVIMNKEFTSEEKLLKLIRKKQKTPQPMLTDDSVTARQGSLDKKKADTKNELGNKDFLKTFNGILIVALVVLCVYAVINYTVSVKNNIPSVVMDDVPAEIVVGEAQELKEDVRPYPLYQEIIEERDIFMSPWEKPSTGAVQNTNSTELGNQYKIVGIVVDNNPQAIIEDVLNSQTIFAYKGDSVGSAVVEEIHEGKVIFLYNNEKIEMVP